MGAPDWCFKVLKWYADKDIDTQLAIDAAIMCTLMIIIFGTLQLIIECIFCRQNKVEPVNPPATTSAPTVPPEVKPKPQTKTETEKETKTETKTQVDKKVSQEQKKDRKKKKKNQ